MTSHAFALIAALMLLSACSTEAVARKPVAPTPAPPAATPAPVPAPAPAAKSGTPSPAGPLRPEMSAEEEQRQLETARRSIGDVARVVGELEGRPMKPPQQEALRTAKTFLDQARGALDQRDYQRAANLASKARALTDDIAGAAR